MIVAQVHASRVIRQIDADVDAGGSGAQHQHGFPGELLRPPVRVAVQRYTRETLDAGYSRYIRIEVVSEKIYRKSGKKNPVRLSRLRRAVETRLDTRL